MTYKVSTVFTIVHNMQLPASLEMIVETDAKTAFIFGHSADRDVIEVFEPNDLSPFAIIEIEDKQFSLNISPYYQKRATLLDIVQEIAKKMNEANQEPVVSKLVLNCNNVIIYPKITPEVAIARGTFNEVLPEIFQTLKKSEKTILLRYLGSTKLHRIGYSQIIFFLMGLCNKEGIKQYSKLWSGEVTYEFVQEIIYRILSRRPDLAGSLADIGSMFIRRKDNHTTAKYYGGIKEMLEVFNAE